MVTKKLKCEDCGGVMEIDQAKSILCCPYCGSKELIEESDSIKKAKIDADVQIKSMEYKEKESRNDIIAIVVLTALCALITLACVAIPLLTQ